MYWKCRYRGCDHMAHQSKTPLKLHQSGSDFHRKLSSYQTLILYWLDVLRKPIKNFNFSGVLGPDSGPLKLGNIRYILIQPI